MPAAIALVIGLSSCSKDEPTGSSNGTTTFRTHLTDAPCDYDHVFIDVQSVVVKYADDTDTTLNVITPGIYDLLALNNGIDTLLTSADIPSGNITQIRLILGENNSIVIDSVAYDLKTPSAQQSGLKIQVNATLTPNTTYDIWLDFDACKSIVERGNGDYNLKPVIRAFTQATTGGLDGFTVPANAANYVYVITSTMDTFGSIPDTNGYYMVQGLPTGTYDVNFTANTNFNDTTVVGIGVNAGMTTRVDTVYF